jgi:predicted PurR-regulated permease PerM
VIVAVVIAVPLGYLASALSREAAHAYEAALHSLSMSQVQDALAGEGGVGKQVQRLAKGLGVETSPEAVRRALSQAASKAASWITPQLNALVTNVFALLYHFAMMLIVVFYGLVDGPALKRRVFTLSPLPDEEEQRIIEKFRDVWSAVMVGNGVGSLLQGALGGLAMWAVGLPSPLLWSVVMTVFAFLPLVGISVVVVPATIYLVLVERFAAAAMFFGFCNVQGLLIENVVKTKLMGDRMQMHSLLIFLAVLGGIGTFGLAGVLYGPLIATFFVTIVDLYERVYRQRFFPDP